MWWAPTASRSCNSLRSQRNWAHNERTQRKLAVFAFEVNSPLKTRHRILRCISTSPNTACFGLLNWVHRGFERGSLRSIRGETGACSRLLHSLLHPKLISTGFGPLAEVVGECGNGLDTAPGDPGLGFRVYGARGLALWGLGLMRL